MSNQFELILLFLAMQVALFTYAVVGVIFVKDKKWKK